MSPEVGFSPEFQAVTSMEDPLGTAEDFAGAIALIAQTISDRNVSGPIQSLAWALRDKIQAAEAIRGALFDMLHPSRYGRAK